MSQPTSSDVHLDAALTDFSIAYDRGNQTWIAGQVFPAKPVVHKTDKFHVFSKDDWFRDDSVKRRTEDTPAPRAGFNLSSDTYDAEAWWTSVPLNEMTRANSDPSVPLDQAAAKLVTQRMNIRRERLWQAAYFATAIWDTDVVGGTNFTKWDDASSDPEKDIQVGVKTVLQNTGFMPNTLIVSFDVHQALKRHPVIKDRFKYTSADSITPAMLARFFEIDRYFISMGVYATHAEGAATETYAFVAPGDALLVYVDMAADVMSPTAGANFVWSGLTGANDLGVRMDSYYDPDTKTDLVRGEFAFDQKVTGSDLGYFFDAAV